MDKKLTTNQITALHLVDRLRMKASEMDLDEEFTATEVAEAYAEEEKITKEVNEYKKTHNRDCLKQLKSDLLEYHSCLKKAVDEWDGSPIQKLINEYKSRCEKIIADSTIDGEFSYECDADDQVYTAFAEAEYNTFIKVINDLERLLKDNV